MYDAKINKRKKNVLIAVDIFMLLIYPPGEFVIVNILDESLRWLRTPVVYVNYKCS